MIVNGRSWHAKMYMWFDFKEPRPSVCSYVAKCTLVPIMFGLFCAIVSPILLIVWLWDKYKNRFGMPTFIVRFNEWLDKRENETKDKTFCPFGRIEFK